MQALLDGLAATGSGEWVFPRGKGDERLTVNRLSRFWIEARDATLSQAAERVAASIQPKLSATNNRAVPAGEGMMGANWQNDDAYNGVDARVRS